MALKPQDKGSSSSVGDRRQQPVPVLFKKDLEEHGKLPGVQARLERVDRMLEEESYGRTG